MDNKNISFIIFSLSVIYITLVIRSAWCTDDAFITFRTIDNFVNGYGLTWNRVERVQAYTHPLWLLFATPFYYITREPYFTILALSIVLSFATVLFICLRLSNHRLLAIFPVIAFISSRTYIDYSTSGLENPLSHLLLALFIFIYLSQPEGKKSIFALFLATGLILLNRLDHVLIILPCLIYTSFNLRKEHFQYVLIGLSPFWIWEIFSIIYYGFPFPNTYYAKTYSGIPFWTLMMSGLDYFAITLYWDPVTLIVICAGIYASTTSKEKRILPVGLGMILYILYVMSVGGDWMLGRLLSSLYLTSVLLIAYTVPTVERFPIHASIIIFLLGFLSIEPSTINKDKYDQTFFVRKGFMDARVYYYDELYGLFGHNRPISFKRASNSTPQDIALPLKAAVTGTIGRYGFFKGNSELYIIDPMALSDAFLSKLPIEGVFFKPGHFKRPLPAGYVETIEKGKNVLVDTDLARFYDDILLIVRGDLFTNERCRAIIRTNLGLNFPDIHHSADWNNRPLEK